MKKYVCVVCGWVYDPAVGDPESGIAPGMAFEDIPDDWVCPLCGVGKDDFEVQEEWSLLYEAFVYRDSSFRMCFRCVAAPVHEREGAV